MPSPNKQDATDGGWERAAPQQVAMRQKIAANARRYIGICEDTGHNDGEPARLFTNGEEVPWCAAFVASVFAVSGNPLPGKAYLLPSVRYMQERIAEAGRFLEPGSHRDVAPGDVIFFRHRGASDPGRGRHCGIVVRIDAEKVHAIEGNSGNCVAEHSYRLTDDYIAGYGRALGNDKANTTP